MARSELGMTHWIDSIIYSWGDIRAPLRCSEGRGLEFLVSFCSGTGERFKVQTISCYLKEGIITS